MTERRLRHRFRRRPDSSSGVHLALSGLLVLQATPLSQIAPLANQPPGAGIGLIAAIGVSVTVGVALIAYLIRPLLAKLTTVRPIDSEPRVDSQEDRWARWEAGVAGTARNDGDSASLASQPEENGMIGTATAIEMPTDQTAQTGAGKPDSMVAAGIAGIVTTLLDCANDGAMLSGFGLYTDRFFQKFAEESGLSLGEFIARYQGPGARAKDVRLLVARIESVSTLPDGRISALVVYSPAGSLSPERYIFSWSPDRSRWLIDDISSEG
jgi:hypothetical protein